MNAITDTNTLTQALPTIASKATKVRLQRGTGYARKRDEHAEAIIRQNLGDQGFHVTKQLFKDKSNPIYKRAQLANELYAYHVKMTLPHTDDGWRVLPNSLYFEYSQTIQDYVARLDQMDANILQNYDHLVQVDLNDRNNTLLGQGKPATASINDYPTREHMARLLYVRYYFEPISTANDFRYSVSEADKARLNELLLQVETNAKADLYSRMLEPMQKFVEKLAVPIGGEGSIFRDSLIGNINDLFTHLPKLNIDNDPVITQKLSELQDIVRPYVFNPDALRENQASRDAARTKVEELMKGLEGYAF